MAEASVARVLRSGAADGEHAAAVMICSAVDTTPGEIIFTHFVESLVAAIVSGTAQARGLVLVASGSSPESYVSRLSSYSSSCFQVLDCFSDPLGWERLISPGKEENGRDSIDIRDLSSLLTKIQDTGKVFSGKQPNGRFAVAIDSLSFLLRHHSLATVSRLICQLRALDAVSVILWFAHSGLHQPRALKSLEYNATAAAFVEPQLEFLEAARGGGGRLRARLKRRNGRLLEKVDEFKMEFQSLKFFPVELTTKPESTSGIHKVQFRLDLSDKELEDRSKVKLPFEHQGGGQELQLYDGRQGGTTTSSEIKSSDTPTIHYLRDSDDEFPDSDEDPDDDLDI